MRIRNTVPSMTAQRNYEANYNRLVKAMERLSSGYRINRAADDAAGLSISEKMRAEISGINMAAKNAQDGLNLVQTAEGAVGQTVSILQRMNEIAVEAATGTLEDADRLALAQEFEQLKQEINDVAGQTNYNNMSLLDGSKSYSGQVRSAQTAGVNLSVSHEQAPEDRTYTLEFDYAKLQDGDQIDFMIGDQNVSITKQAGDTRSSYFSRLSSAVESAGGRVSGNAVVSKGTEISQPALADYMKSDSNALLLQIGSLQNQQMSLSIDCMNTAALGLDGINLFDQDSAGAAVTASRNALAKATDQWTTLGATTNRLEYKIANLTNTSLNLQEAESRIRDVDIAAEMTEYMKASILTQTGIAMMAQCNALSQNVLSLLG